MQITRVFKGGLPQYLSGLLGGKTVGPITVSEPPPFGVLSQSHRAVPNPPPPGGGRAQHPPDPDLPSCRSRCRVQAAPSQAKQNPAALTSCGTVTRPSATGFRTPPPRVPRPPMLVQTSPTCTRTPGRGSALHAASPGRSLRSLGQEGFQTPRPYRPRESAPQGGLEEGAPPR